MNFGKIAVPDGGPGGHAAVGYVALHSFEAHFWGCNPQRLTAVFQSKQIMSCMKAGINGLSRC